MNKKTANTPTIFQRLKKFINTKYMTGSGIFSTREMCAFVNESRTNSTPWKRWNNNPNYTTHVYLGDLHALGCVTRVKHGHYQINSPIPDWFGSYHFAGLQGRLEDKSNLYWNCLPAWQKVNPWADGLEPKQNRIEDALGGWPDLEPMREKYPANVEGSIEQRIAAMEAAMADLIDEQTKRLENIKSALIELKALADEQNQVELRYTSEYVDRIFEVTYLGGEYRVVHTYNSDDVFDENWKVDNYVDDEIDNSEIAQYLIDWVKQNCK